MFFEVLESTGGLDVDSDEHIWLIHYLFLDDINDEILEWGETWNNHKITTPGVGSESPKALKLWSIATHGIRGITDSIPDEELAEYGIDWDAIDNIGLQVHHNNHNAPELQNRDPLLTHRPDRHTMVEVQAPNCPLNSQQISQLDVYLDSIGDQYHEKKTRWILALAFCRSLL